MHFPNHDGVSVVIPVFNEHDNILPLFEQILFALQAFNHWEVIFVNDGSTDQTTAVLDELCRHRCVSVIHKDSRQGQSAAIFSGVQQAQYDRIVTLDGDGQNDPGDIPRSLDMLANIQTPCLVAGIRVQRQDSFKKKWASRIANGVRQLLLNDDCPDTGCGVKAFYRQHFLQLPFFDHMHRFLPALFKHCLGARIICFPVKHHPRMAGQSKYGIGNRLWVGITDMLGVCWLIRRYKNIRSVQMASVMPAKNNANRKSAGL